jgi:hypothetical protein
MTIPPDPDDERLAESKEEALAGIRSVWRLQRGC